MHDPNNNRSPLLFSTNSLSQSLSVALVSPLLFLGNSGFLWLRYISHMQIMYDVKW